MTQFEPITPSQAANLLASSIKSNGQYYLATSDGGQPGQTIQVNGIVAICQQSIPPGPIILVNQGQQWYAYAPRINQESSTRVVQNSRRRRRKGAKNRYKITIFYLTQDNSVFCREDDESPIKLVDKLPKRVELNIGGSASFGGTSIVSTFGWALHDSFSLDDYKIFTPPNSYIRSTTTYTEPIPLIEIVYGSRSTADLVGSFTTEDTSPSAGARLDIFLGSTTFLLADLREIQNPGLQFYTGIAEWNTYSWHGDAAYARWESAENLYFFEGVYATRGSGSASLLSMSNSWGFAARSLPDKTVFAVTDGVSLNQDFLSVKNRITTGTLDQFETYQLPTQPELDPDLFPLTFDSPPPQWVNYFLVNGGQFSGLLINNSYERPPYLIYPSLIGWDPYYNTINKPGPILLLNPYNDDFFTLCAYGQGSQEDLEEQLKGVGSFELQVYDSQLHDIVFELDENETTPIKHQSEWRQNIRTAGDFETVTISGLPSDTKRILGILAVPINE